MAKKHILITGAAGFLGKNLYQTLQADYDVKGLDHHESKWSDYVVDISKKGEVVNAVKDASPDVIIHTAALADAEYCETHPDEAQAINVNGTKHFVDAMAKNAKMIFISSDYVYDGTKSNYTEQSKVHPLGVYARTKVEGEKIVKKHPNHLILRHTVIFGWDVGGKNFFMQLYENQGKRQPMNVPIDQYSNPTYVKLLVAIIQKSTEKELRGTFVATGKETINRFDFAMKICDVFAFDKTLILPFKTSDLGQISKRPLNCGTDSGKLQKTLSLSFPSLNESLQDIKSSLHTQGIL